MAKMYEIIGRLTYEVGATVKAASEDDAKTILGAIFKANAKGSQLEGPGFSVTFPPLDENDVEIVEIKEASVEKATEESAAEEQKTEEA